MTQATHDRLGSGKLMPAELFAAGVGVGMGVCRGVERSSAGGDLVGLLHMCQHSWPPPDWHLPRMVHAGGDAVTAHPHVDSNTGRFISFSYR